ncbi:MAG: FMN-binding protein [Nostocoides sp.]
MRRITLWTLSTITVVVLLFSYRTSTSSRTAASVVAAGTTIGGGDLAANGSTTPSDSGSTSTDPTPAASPTPSASTRSSTAGSLTAAKTYTGTAIDTQFGPVQVQITVVAGKVTRSVVTQVPWNDPRDQEINSQAVPILNQEVVRAQNASIDMVSGATYTSDGYVQSLQSALDQAKI